jgi:hypothetical protein
LKPGFALSNAFRLIGAGGGAGLRMAAEPIWEMSVEGDRCWEGFT